jgi:hypothetical protein
LTRSASEPPTGYSWVLDPGLACDDTRFKRRSR